MIDKHELPMGECRMRFPVGQFLALFLPVAAVILVAGFSFVELRSDAQLDALTARERTQLHLLSGFIGADVFNASNQLSGLAQERIVRRAIDAPTPAHLRALESELMILAKRNPTYQQIRWIDETGWETVRVMRDRGPPFVVPRGSLQDKSQRYYFGAARALSTGEIYVSPIDLNVEQETIELPPRPVFRVAIAIEDGRGQSRGMLVVNISAGHLLELAREPNENLNDSRLFLLNGSGQDLTVSAAALHPDWQGDRLTSFAHSQPTAWRYVSASRASSVELNDGFWVWETLSPTEALSKLESALDRGYGMLPRVISDDAWLKLVSSKPIGTIVAQRRETRIPVILGGVLILIAYAWSLVFYLRSQMAEKRAELNIAYAMAHAQKQERLKELEERFRLLAEASSVGLLLVDPDGKVVMSNPAAESMFGYAKKELEGISVENLLPPDLRLGHTRLRAKFMEAPETRKMGGQRPLKAVRKDGRQIPVEVGLNPCMDHGKQLVLANIIDLSESAGVTRDAGRPTAEIDATV